MNDMPAFSRPIRAADVPPEGKRVEIVADERERTALARDFGLIGIDRFTAAFDLARTRAGGLAVAGRLDADVRQTCVVTLDPFEAHVADGIEMIFLPEDAPGAEDAVDEDVDVLVDGRVDLGAVASEFLALALDPHPRKPGAVFEAVTDRESAPASPFSALAAVASGNKPADPAAEK
jgi:uncharacterized metal-binding protein YceD (DUF177 family)